MNTLKGWITTTFLATAVLLSTTTANAGVIIGGLTEEGSCKEPTTGRVDSGVIIGGLGGVIIGGFTGVIIGGFTGVIIGGAADDTTVNCGVIIGG